VSSERKGADPQAEPSYVAETRYDAADPVVLRFRAALQDVQASELRRLFKRLPALDEDSRMAICQFSDYLVATMLQSPLESLHTELHSDPPHKLRQALERLFRLSE
jgi:glutamyl-tRNA reductase